MSTPSKPPLVEHSEAVAKMLGKYVGRSITRPNAVAAVRAGLINAGHSELNTLEVVEAIVTQIMAVTAPIEREDMVPRSEYILLRQKLSSAEQQLSWLRPGASDGNYK